MRLRRLPAGQISLSLVLILAALGVVGLGYWTYSSTHSDVQDGRQTIVFWGGNFLGDEIYALVHRFEEKNPQYKVVMSASVARDLVGDAQRLMCAIAGDVPPDVVFFDRFAIGEWAARGALTDLDPYLAKQDPKDPFRIDLNEYYDFTVKEASYAPPGSGQKPRLFGMPITADSRELFINCDLLRQAGLVDEHGKPKPPKDWDELRQYASKLTLYERPNDKSSRIVRLGFAPNTGNSYLYIYSWQAGGEFMNPERTKVTLDAPPNVRALRYMTECYDDLGGVEKVDAYQQNVQVGDLDPFLRGTLAMQINVAGFMETIADWKPDMDFMMIPAPMPGDQLAAGKKPITWAGGHSLVIPETAKQKQGAFKLIQYICSEEGERILEQGRHDQKSAEGRLYIPRGLANRRLYEAFIKEYVDSNPRLPAPFKDAFATIRELMPNTLIRPVTPVGQLLWNKHMRAYEAGVRHEYRDEAKATGQDEYKLALQRNQVEVQQGLDEILNPPPSREVNWTPYFLLYAALIALPFVALAVAYRKRKREYGYRAREVGAAMLFLSPWAVGFAAFVGGPILFSIIFSFTRYDVLSPARYVGVSNYTNVASDPNFYISLLNTAYMIIAIPLTMVVSLAIALLLNRAIRGIGFYRAAFYMPAIVPLVAASLMWIWLLNPSYGLINGALAWFYDTAPMQWLAHLITRMTGQPFHFGLPLWLQSEDWSKPSLILMKLWSAGGGMIIWLAGLQSIPQEMYEAAKVDGASAWQRFKSVTIPLLSPYILFNLIIGLIGTMQIFAESYIMTTGGPKDSTMFYAYYLFKQAFQFFRMGYASALAWILFIVVLVLTLTQLWLSQKWVHYEQG
ncbi:MAG TPA: extracellular solute-binding protein [Tepidisphaeraceae bacterium]|nr:extracellular solute-binding protein [Tepidisphaeraceae bacterium]